MAAAFLAGLHRRVDRDPNGKVTLPTGVANVAEVGQVLRALDRARHDDGGDRR